MEIETENLVEIPLRYRDASVHFYDKENDRVVSQDNYGKWYISPFASDIKFEYLQPEKYKKKVEKAKKLLGERYRNQSLDEAKYLSKYKPLGEILKKNSHGFIKIDRNTITQLVENKYFEYYLVDGNATYAYTPYRIENLPIDQPEKFIPVKTETRNPPTRAHDFIFDIECDDETYLLFGNAQKIPITKDLVLCLRQCPYTMVKFSKEVKYSCLTSMNADLMLRQSRICSDQWMIQHGVLMSIVGFDDYMKDSFGLI